MERGASWVVVCAKVIPSDATIIDEDPFLYSKFIRYHLPRPKPTQWSSLSQTALNELSYEPAP